MRNTLMKKLAFTLLTILLVGVMIVGVACNQTPNTDDPNKGPDPQPIPDPFAGNFKKVANEDREDVIATAIDKVEYIWAKGMDKYKMTYKVSSESEYDGEKTTYEIDATITVDEDKICVEMTCNLNEDGDKTKYTATVWADMDSMDIYYSVKYDGQKKVEGKYDFSDDLDEDIEDAIYSAEDLLYMSSEIMDLLEDLVDYIDDTIIYADGDNVKAVFEETSKRGSIQESNNKEIIIVFDGDTFSLKLTSDYKYKDEDEEISSSYTMTIEPSKASVKMPNFD